MKKISISYDDAYNLIKKTCTTISRDNYQLMEQAYNRETNIGAKNILGTMLENVRLAEEYDKPVCQSPGYPTIYIRYGDNSDLLNIKEYFIRGLVNCTKDGYLRPSIVHPLNRENSGDNSGEGTPNFEFQPRPGQEFLEVIISFKGCGAELGNNMKIMTTAQLGRNLEGLKRLVLSTVIEAGGKPCPPVGLGIGIGGQMDVAAKLSRESISTRNWLDENPDPQLMDLEKKLLEDINSLHMGAAGIGGDTYCLAVKIGMAATHTAICPVAVNFHCWVTRKTGVRIYPDGRWEYLFSERILQ